MLGELRAGAAVQKASFGYRFRSEMEISFETFVERSIGWRTANRQRADVQASIILVDWGIVASRGAGKSDI
jgi:hypothetical protein